MAYQTGKSLPFHYRRSSAKKGRIGEITIKENGIVVDFMTFKSEKDFNLVSGKLKKYGWGQESKRDIDDEINCLDDFYKKNGV